MGMVFQEQAWLRSCASAATSPTLGVYYSLRTRPRTIRSDAAYAEHGPANMVTVVPRVV